MQIENDIVSMVRWFTGLLSYWFTTAKHQIEASAMRHGFREVEFGWYKSVVQ